PLPRRIRRQIARRGVGGPGVAVFAVEPAACVDQVYRRIDRLDSSMIGGGEALNDQDIDTCHRQRLLAPMWATALISTFSDGLAKAATCTRVEAGKLPVKNSRRACHTFSRRLISVTKIVTVVMSAIVPPAASTR